MYIPTETYIILHLFSTNYYMYQASTKAVNRKYFLVGKRSKKNCVVLTDVKKKFSYQCTIQHETVSGKILNNRFPPRYAFGIRGTQPLKLGYV